MSKRGGMTAQPESDILKFWRTWMLTLRKRYSTAKHRGTADFDDHKWYDGSLDMKKILPSIPTGFADASTEQDEFTSFLSSPNLSCFNCLCRALTEFAQMYTKPLPCVPWAVCVSDRSRLIFSPRIAVQVPQVSLLCSSLS